LGAPTPGAVLTQFRLAVFAMAALAAAWAGQASAFWPFAPPPVRIEIAPAYGGVCEDCDLSGRLLAGAKMSNSVFNGSDFSGAVMTRVDASHSAFRGANFRRVDLTRALLLQAHCEDADFQQARMQNVLADGAVFDGANFNDADVEGGSFISARLVGVRLRNARMRGANLSGADLRQSTGLTQRQLSQACGDEQTRLPRGLRIRYCAGVAN
jgi:uncharacterized protein YjbI with pentapeptide repeats